ncbi:MAG: FecCD family ABC transporter permease [Egibacteraceae bacterium]
MGRHRHRPAPGRNSRLDLPVPSSLGVWWLLGGVAAVVGAVLLSLAVGPVRLDPLQVLRELLWFDNGLTDTERAILWQLRLPRTVLALLVGASLAMAGAGYQGVFRNPLADPYFLGAAAGAGLGVTLVIVAGGASTSLAMPVAAFTGALAAVTLTYALGAAGGHRMSTTSLVLAGVAVASFLTAVQTYLLQRQQDNLRQVYSWILGRLSTAGWREVVIVLPYAVAAMAVLLLHRRILDILAVGDDEAATLGVHARRVRFVVAAAASLGTAAAVSVSGLIGFVGIIVPHTVRLLAGGSHRVILPLSLLFGGAFLTLADLAAKMVSAPAELPIGVVTAFFGAPFFVLVLRTAGKTLP